LQLCTKELVIPVKWKIFPTSHLVNHIVLLCMPRCAHVKVHPLSEEIMVIAFSLCYPQSVGVNPLGLGDMLPLQLQTELQALEELPSLVVLGHLIVQLRIHSA
jgi:hypothetical protein